jgi:hypothetical protein
MLDHDDDIICLATDERGKLCATGQVGAKPWICVWDTNSKEVYARF